MTLMRSYKRLVFASLLLFCAPFAAVADEAPASGSWRDFPPSEMHQQMGLSKSRALLDQRFAQQSISQVAVNNQTDYDVTFYDVNLRVNDTTEILFGKVTIVAVAQVNGLSTVEIDFFQNMITDSIIGDAGSLSFGYVGNNLMQINLGQTYDLGETFSFDFYYHGHPVEGGFQAFSFGSRNGAKVMASLSEPYFARTWWPCKDRMDDKPDSMDIAVEIRSDYYCASNGTLDSVVTASANSEIYYYSVRYPITTYLFSVAISNYTVWEQDYVYNGGADTMPVVHSVFPDMYSYSLPRWGVTPQAIGVLSDVFGPYPFPNEKYGHANFLWGGGMEHQTVTSMTGGSFGFWEPVVVHELGHQWWGDMITCLSWRDIWLNEGWATYAEALWYENINGHQDYLDYMTNMEYSGGGTLYLTDTSSTTAIFTGLPYDKGAWLIHMLRGVIGDSLFFAGIDAYYNSVYKYGAASTAQFVELYESVVGYELDWFFDDWLYGEYRPTYYWSIFTEPADGGGFTNYIALEQVQTSSPQVFSLPFEILLHKTNGVTERISVFNDTKTQVYVAETDFAVDSILIDPDNWILNYQDDDSWTLFIVSQPGDIKDGMQSLVYNDTVEVRGGTHNYTVTLLDGALPPGLSIDNHGVISGTPTDTGEFTFTVRFDDNAINWDDESTFTFRIDPAIGIAGDVDDNGTVALTDLTLLVNYLFVSGPPVTRPDLADVSGDCSLGLTDITLLVNHLFVTFEPLTLGCVK